MPLRITGAEGVIRWGYHSAGTLRPWAVTKDDAESFYRLSGTLVSPDAFRLSQRPLAFVAPLKAGSWRWPILELQIVDGALSARLGPKEH